MIYGVDEWHFKKQSWKNYQAKLKKTYNFLKSNILFQICAWSISQTHVSSLLCICRVNPLIKLAQDNQTMLLYSSDLPSWQRERNAAAVFWMPNKPKICPQMALKAQFLSDGICYYN